MPCNQEAYEALPFPKPPYDPAEHDKHLAGLQEATSYEDYFAYQSHLETEISRNKSPTKPSKDFAELFDGWDFESGVEWDTRCECKHKIKVFSVFCRLISWLGIAPGNVDEKCDDAFVWGRVLCCIAAAGHPHFKALCNLVRQSYPQFPYGEEDYEEWEELITEASQLTGWPCTLPNIPWSNLRGPPQEAKNFSLEQYGPAKVVGLMHVLKHCYVNPTSSHIHVLFRGQTHVKPCKIGENLWEGVGQTASLARALESNYDGRATKVALQNWGVQWALKRLIPRNLVRLLPRTKLPPAVLYGPWSSTIPHPDTRKTFIQHGVRLSGVWVARHGQIVEETGDDEDILGWDWDSTDAFTADNLATKRRFQDAIPDKYHTVSPFTVFREAFPNLVYDNEATSVLFDLPIYADLLRSYIPCLESEFPMALFLPSKPTLEDSTNQGKSLAALTYARSMVPGIQLTRIRDQSGGAPQQRADCAKLEQFGTLCLDEWRPPRSDGHILSHDNLQSLIVGGTITAGKVLENQGEVKLAHSIVASAKCIHFPDDMINRSFFWYLDNLTDEMRANAEMLDSIRNGNISLLMRLGAWADIETNDLIERLTEASKCSGVLRFEGCNTLAHILCSMRGIQPEHFRVAVKRMAAKYSAHFQEAEDSGLTRAAQDNGLRIGLSDIMEWDNTELNDIREACNALGGFVSVRDLLKAMLRIVEGNAAQPLAALLPRLIGEVSKVSDRAIIMRVTSEIRRRLDENEYTMHPSPLMAAAGWYFARCADQGGVMVRILNSLKDGEPDKFGLERRQSVPVP